MTTAANTTTELVFILDKSGSMAGLEPDTLGGYNSMLEKQKTLDGECRVTTLLFDCEPRIVHDRVDIRQIRSMTEQDYQPGGYTALLDALGMAIYRTADVQKHTPVAQRAGKVMLVIITDGMENASREYKVDWIRGLILQQQQRFGWEFLFLGANIDAIQTAHSYGITMDKASNYVADSTGTDVGFKALDKTIERFRRGDKDFHQELDAVRGDHARRGQSGY